MRARAPAAPRPHSHTHTLTAPRARRSLYLFACQLAQIPMIMAGRLPVVKRNPLAGNLFFWVGLLTGFPLLCVAYVTY